MPTTLAKVQNLTLRYGTITAVKNVSFELFSGEILAVIGPNGSGKTSTIECLEGLRKPTDGNLELLGCNPFFNRREIYTEVGIQLQEAEYPDKIKVKELCRLFSSFYENPLDWKILLEQFGLADKSDRTVKKLSGGEKQRLSILLALLPRPKLLILDELTTGLDPEVRHSMWDSLDQIRQSGTSILLVSHYLDEVEFLADRLLYMENGCALFIGSQDEFRAYAKSRIPDEKWEENLSLEDLYLLLAPKTNTLQLKDLMEASL